MTNVLSLSLNRVSRLFLLLLSVGFSSLAFADGVTINKNNAKVDFTEAATNVSTPYYIIKKSVGRYGAKSEVTQTKKTVFTDKDSNAKNCYYFIEDANGKQLAMMAHDIDLFGKDVLIMRPTDQMNLVHQAVEDIHTEMFREQFGAGRYAVLFMPGDYREAGVMNVPYYEHLAGLGRTPYDVKIHNIHTPAPLNNDNGTCTFWRSLENLSVIGPDTYEHDETFLWAVSQAAPIRRVYSERAVRNQWHHGWVSGGFTADCNFMAAAGSDGQQQWYTRNTHL